MPLTDLTPAGSNPDATALALASAVQAAILPDTVILFGSRARGDHRAHSDFDLMLVCQGNTFSPRAKAQQAVKDYFRDHPPRLGVDIVAMTRERFDYCKRARNHVAGQALRDGVITSGERLDYLSSYEDDYPASWPDVKEKLQAAYRQLNTFNRMMEAGDFPQEDYGFHPQQAVGNALKSWLSAADLPYGRVHDLEETGKPLLNDPAESQTLAGAQLQLMLDYTRVQDTDHIGETRNWLTLYAVDYRYSGTGFRMTDLDQNRFQSEINLAVRSFINRAHELTGTDETDVTR